MKRSLSVPKCLEIKEKTAGWIKFFNVIFALITMMLVLVILLPWLESGTGNSIQAGTANTASLCNMCNVKLVETIPEGLIYSETSPKFLSTHEAWNFLLDVANNSVDIGSFYWTLRGADFYNHSSAAEGEKIFRKIIATGTGLNTKIRIAQSAPTELEPNFDTELLEKHRAADIRSINFPRLFGGGVLHTKLWIVDDMHFYLGSANMDWRSLSQVKELGVLVTNCTCLAEDVSKIFKTYWFLGQNNSHVPSHWPDEYSTKINLNSPLEINYNNAYKLSTFFSSSPPPLTSNGRTEDLDAILNTILNAKSFVYISVMDYLPLIIYRPKIRYWHYIDDSIRTAAVENKVLVKMLISWWIHSRPEEDYFLRSLQTLSNTFPGVDIQIRRFKVPANEDQKKIPFARVNHNKYMVTDKAAYIGTSNWSGDYFTDTAGIGLVFQENNSTTNSSVRTDLLSIFNRDWNSPYAEKL